MLLISIIFMALNKINIKKSFADVNSTLEQI